MTRRTTRRDFVKASALAGVGFWVAGGSSVRASRLANDEISFACIGVGGKGTSDSDDASKFGKVVAVCDIDENTLDKAAEKFGGAKKFFDFRKMLEDMGSSIDAVTVSTPDHTHAVAAIMAMQMGKHCFCQKPLTHSLFEARRMAEVAREKKVATQMGNQGTAGSTLREAAAFVQAGAVGEVTEAHVWTNRPIWAQGGPRPAEKPVPSQVHWEEWLGPAPYRPYAPGYHPFAWRGWWDFGTGALGDMACHTLNFPFMALDLRDPISVQAETTGHNKDSYPKSSTIVYEFAKTDKRPALKFTWYDGGRKVSRDLLDGQNPSDSGCLIVGKKGKLYAPGDYCENGVTKLGDFELPKVEYVKSPGHFEEWVQAIKGGPDAVSNFPNYSGALTETVLLGNLAVWADGKKVEWDAKNLTASGADDLSHIIKNEYRDGYSI